MAVSPFDLVRGGTTTQAYDQQLAMQRADTAKRRAHDDLQRSAAARTDAKLCKVADLGSHQNHAIIVLDVLARDKSIQEHIICELSAEDDDLVLVVVCPRCVFTLNRRQTESQLTIRRSHRGFDLDTRTVAEGGSAGKPWGDPTLPDHHPNKWYQLAGEITTHRPVRCDHLGCGYRFAIDKNVLRSAD
jgi:hypothetical protein